MSIISIKFTALATSFLLGASLLACALSSASCQKRQPPLSPRARYILFIDTTASVSEAQSAHWLGMASRVLSQLGSGDGLTIFEISDHTLEQRALYEAELPVLPPHPGIRQLRDFKQRLAHISQETQTALQRALERPSRALNSDIFSALDRIKPEPEGRRVVLVFLSDMLHSADNQELNFERTPVQVEQFDAMITRLAQKHRWHAASFAQVSAHVILPSAVAGDSQPLNDRRILKQFYDRLFKALGATLRTFDTSFDKRIS